MVKKTYITLLYYYFLLKLILSRDLPLTLLCIPNCLGHVVFLHLEELGDGVVAPGLFLPDTFEGVGKLC